MVFNENLKFIDMEKEIRKVVNDIDSALKRNKRIKFFDGYYYGRKVTLRAVSRILRKILNEDEKSRSEAEG